MEDGMQSPEGAAKGVAGRVCLFCDRKFILYDTYAEFACQIEHWDKQIKDHQ